jgi:hypothetical protein
MCYLLAKKFKREGCIALKTEYGPKLAALDAYLGRSTLDKDVQIIVVSHPEAYKEYAPYRIVDSEVKFIEETLAM